jgi:hypothetical protein
MIGILSIKKFNQVQDVLPLQAVDRCVSKKTVKSVRRRRDLARRYAARRV